MSTPTPPDATDDLARQASPILPPEDTMRPDVPPAAAHAADLPELTPRQRREALARELADLTNAAQQAHPTLRRRFDVAEAMLEQARTTLHATEREYTAAFDALKDAGARVDAEIRRIRLELRQLASPLYDAFLTKVLRDFDAARINAGSFYGLHASLLTREGVHAMGTLVGALCHRVRDLQEDGQVADDARALEQLQATTRALVQAIARDHAADRYRAMTPRDQHAYHETCARQRMMPFDLSVPPEVAA